MKLNRRRLKAWAIKTYGYRCMSCGIRKDIQYDHIYPKSKYPRLEFKKSNGQLLCGPGGNRCNQRKSNIYIDDLRPLWAKAWFGVIRLLNDALLTCLLLALLHAVVYFRPQYLALSPLSHCPAAPLALWLREYRD